jgi:hypothetical protein
MANLLARGAGRRLAVATNTSMKRGWKLIPIRVCTIHKALSTTAFKVATNTSMKRGWK